MDNVTQVTNLEQIGRDAGEMGGGRVEPPAPTDQFLATGEKRADETAPVKRGRGRPRGSPNKPKVAPEPGAVAAPAPAPVKASPGDKVRRRQRADCRALADRVQALMAEPDCGAGRDGNRAAALGTLTRAVATLHELEREAFGLAGDTAAGRDKVLVLPVPVSSMDEWAKMALSLAGGAKPAPPQALDVGPRRARDDGPGDDGGA